jgi:hypothetical protein
LVGWQQKKVLSKVPDYSEMLDDWQRRLEAAPKFGPTFEGFDYRTPEYERLSEAQSKVDQLITKQEVAPAEVQATADEFKNAFIANRQNLQKQLGPSATPVNESLDRFFQVAPGATQQLRLQGNPDDYRHEIYSHLHPWDAGLSPDYRGFQGNTLSYKASPITPLNEGVAVWSDRAMRSPIGNVEAGDPSNLGNYFKDFVDRVAENDEAFRQPGGAEPWKQQYGSGKDIERTHELGKLYREKYLDPATQRFSNLANAQVPGGVRPGIAGASTAFEELVRNTDFLNDELEYAGRQKLFPQSFIERNLLFSKDPVTAGIQGAGEMLRSAPRGIAGGAALSALSPDVAKSVEQGQYGKAATRVAQDIAAGVATDLGIQAAGQGLQRVAPQLASRVIPAFSGAASVAVPAAVGAGLFMQGKQGSPLNTVINKAADVVPGLRPNPKTDVGRMAGRALSNEAQYAWNQIRQGKMPWMGR